MSRITRQDIGRCKDCKWWDCCDRAIDYVGTCAKLASNVWASDVDSKELITERDFGCIHWEGKE